MTTEKESALGRIRLGVKYTAKGDPQPDLTVEGFVGVSRGELTQLFDDVFAAHSEGFGKVRGEYGSESERDAYKEQLEASLADTNGAEATPG